MRYIVQTFGCQMNAHDSRRIEEVLDGAGWSVTDDAALADAIVFNTCSVREKAEHKLLSILGTVRPLKEERPSLVVVVAGCVAQQEGERLLSRSAVVDVVLGPDNIAELPGLITNAQAGAPPIARTVFDLDTMPLYGQRFLVASPRQHQREVTSFVTVMKGCDERCTFCVVPYTRGPERYRAASEIIDEIRTMARGGTREITLLGQTVNSWHEPGGRDEGESQFAALLTRIAHEVPELPRLRYTSPHPRHVTPALVRAHAELSILPAHVHLPVQSGSNRVLKRMLRRYTREHYVERAHALKSARRGLTLSSDFIVGFPGETRAEFDETLSLVREVGFSAAFAFKYSPRPHTPALKLDDDVSEAEKDARLAELFEAVAEGQRAHLATLVGTRAEVLVEGPGKDKQRGGAHRYRGRSERHEIVHFDAPEGRDPTGMIVPVMIQRANDHSLEGAIELDASAIPERAILQAPPPKPRSLRKLPMFAEGETGPK
jgi:tRNA-2-methylthio-N6-dimethylallyladenosine synthase